MPLTRTINVITLACLLFLTGCFGLTNDTITPEADGQTTATNGNNTINHAPIIKTWDALNAEYMKDAEKDISYDSVTGEEVLNGFEIALFHAAVDIDGDTMTMGWDIDLDGAIDYLATNSSGFTNLAISIEHWTSFADVGLTEETDNYFTMVAFIAIDQHGAGDAQIVEVVVDREQSDNGGSTITSYQIMAEDAQGSPTTGTEDTLLRVTMTQGHDINWAAISVKISVNNEPPLTCDNNNQSTGPCWLDEFGTDTTDNEWSVGDGFTITEKSDICDGTSECKIEITITNTQLEENIDKSSAVAA